jgi:nicotinate-nucleotide adenylyltransferase
MRIGLFFGSFNPVHVGHMIIANYVLENTSLEKIWMVVSPHNPHKKRKSLAKDHDRLHLVRLAINDNKNISASDIEFSLPRPSYTIDTLTYLEEKFPKYEFSLIMGADNLISLPRWKNYEQIIERFKIFVYNRPSYDDAELKSHENVTFLNAPLLNISSSYIRRCVTEGKSIQYLTTDKVFEYLEETPIYKHLLT